VPFDMLGLVRELQTTADDNALRPDADDFVRSTAIESHPSSADDSADSHTQQLKNADQAKPRHLHTLVRWAVNVLIIGALAAAMGGWLIFLAWGGRRLLAML